MTEPEHSHEDEDGYTGPATALVAGTELPVDVQLRGHFQPIDGYYHWYGRVAADQRLTDAVGGRKAAVSLRTPHGSADGELSDPDPWGRYRVLGTSTPPFPVLTDPG